MSVNRRRIWAGLAMSLMIMVAACSGQSGSSKADTVSKDAPCAPAADGSLKKVNFQLNFTAGGYNSGFALAKQEGYYKKAGLDVNIIKGQGSSTTAKLVASGQADIAYADAVAAMQLIAKGAKMKVVSTLYQSVPNSVTVLKSSGITSIADLKGKKVGEPIGETPSAVLPILLKANGLSEADVKRIPMPGTSMVAALRQKKVDAILGSTDGYSLILKNSGAHIVDFPFVDHGVVTVSTSIIASDSYLAKDPHTVRCFVNASLKGWDTAIKDNQLAIKDLVKTFPDDTQPKLNLEQLKAAIDLFCKDNAKAVGKAEPEAWKSTVDVAERALGLPKGTNPTDYYTYSYLPAKMPTKCPISNN